MDNLNVIGTLRLLTLSDPGVIKLFLEGGGRGRGRGREGQPVAFNNRLVCLTLIDIYILD